MFMIRGVVILLPGRYIKERGLGAIGDTEASPYPAHTVNIFADYHNLHLFLQLVPLSRRGSKYVKVSVSGFQDPGCWQRIWGGAFPQRVRDLNCICKCGYQQAKTNRRRRSPCPRDLPQAFPLQGSFSLLFKVLRFS